MTRVVLAVAVLAGALASAQAQLRGHGGPVRALAVSPDGRTAISGSFDETVIRWSLARGDQREIIMLFRQRNESKSRGMRDRRDGHAPIGAVLRHGGGDRVVGLRLVPVAIRSDVAEQPIDQDARAGALVAVDHDAGGIAECRAHGVLRAQSLETLITGAEHNALHPPPARHQFKSLAKKRRVVAIGFFIEQMNGRKIAFAAFCRRQSAEAADRDRAHHEARTRKLRGHEIEPGAVAADDDEIRHPHMRREQRHLGLGTGRHLVGQCIDPQESICLGERRDRTRTLAGGIGDQAAIALDQRHHDEFGAAEFGSNPHRHSRRDLGIGARRQPGHPAQHRHDHVVKGEHRRGRKSRQDHHRLAVADREAQWLTRFQRHAMGDDAGFSQPRDDAMRHIAGAL